MRILIITGCRNSALLGSLFASGEPGEILALELREATRFLGTLVGLGVTDDVLNEIFSRFCIGK